MTELKMNRIKRIGLLSCFSVCMFCVGNAQKVEDDGNVEINASCRLQTLEGWGTSLCWWAAQVGLWDSKKVNEITNFIVSPDKLNMNIFRYNIGGGDDPSHIGGHMVKGKGRRAEMEGFKVSSTAPYNWNADAAQRKILLMLKKKREDAIFEAFSNSAPYWMTYSGCAAGNNDALKDNLKPEYYGQICDYLIDVCKYYKQRFNVNFRTLEPFNESLSNYWYNQGTQEGCHFEPQSQINLIRLLYGKLRASGLRTEISASDETSLSHTIKIQHVYHDAGDIWNKLGQINTHTYSGSDAERSKVHDLSVQAGKRLWQSETGPSGGKGLKSNLMLTQKMFDDLKIMQPVAWLDWQTMEESGDEWCVMNGNFKTHEFHLVKNFYVRMQITRFFKRGYTLVGCDAKNILVAVSPSKKECVIAILNDSASEQSKTLHLVGFHGLHHVNVWRTSETEDCKQLASTTVDKNLMICVAPAYSLTTFVISK